MELAVTHRSWCAEHADSESNERLEFLGDAVLGMAVTEHLYAQWPDRPEGDLAQMRAAVVNAVTLAEVAVHLDLGRALRLGKGEDAAGGRDKPSILSDALEALFGAVYLDGGWDEARRVVLHLVEDRVTTPDELLHRGDFKTRLQELVVARFSTQVPRYEVASSGPDHAKRFRARVWVAGDVLGEGAGRSKKEAEQAAAGSALAALMVSSGSTEDTTDEGEVTSDA